MAVRSARIVGPVVVVLSLVLAGCSGDDDATSTSTTAGPATTLAAEQPAPEPLRILVTNDDGYDAPGLDAVVEALLLLPDTEVHVVAPDGERSGSGGQTTEGEQTITEVATASGHPAVATDGFPADAVNWALEGDGGRGGIDVTPDLVVSGINSGQNLGALGDQFSGTIGAARAGAARGIPALATSMGAAEDADYELAATYVVEWITQQRDALLAGTLAGDAIVVFNLNVPSCTDGEIRGVVEVPMSNADEDAFTDQDCTSDLGDPPDDITAFNNGFVTVSQIGLEPAPRADG